MMYSRSEKCKKTWFFTRLSVPLAALKVLSLDNSQINLELYSLIRTFAYKMTKIVIQ